METTFEKLKFDYSKLSKKIVFEMLEFHYQYRFKAQRTSAKKRGIEFKLSFEQWLRIWLNSGKLFERGHKRTNYVMGRHGDVGPYSARNVAIITVKENCSMINGGKKYSEQRKEKIRKFWRDNPHSEEHRKKISTALKGRKFSDGHRAKLSAARMGKGHPHTEETKRKMSASHKTSSKALAHQKRLHKLNEQSGRPRWIRP